MADDLGLCRSGLDYLHGALADHVRARILLSSRQVAVQLRRCSHGSRLLVDQPCDYRSTDDRGLGELRWT